MPKTRKDGWFKTIRTDPRTGMKRPVKILYRQGFEIRTIYLDKNMTPEQVEISKATSKAKSAYHAAKRKYHELGQKLADNPDDQKLRKEYQEAKQKYHETGANFKHLKFGD